MKQLYTAPLPPKITQELTQHNIKANTYAEAFDALYNLGFYCYIRTERFAQVIFRPQMFGKGQPLHSEFFTWHSCADALILHAILFL